MKDGEGTSLTGGWAQSPRSKSCWGPVMRGPPAGHSGQASSQSLRMGRAEEGQQFPSGHQQPPWPGSDLWDPEFRPRVEVPFLLPMAWIGGGGSGGHSKPRDKWFRFSKACATAGAVFPSPSEGQSPWWALLHPPTRAPCPAPGMPGTA